MKIKSCKLENEFDVVLNLSYWGKECTLRINRQTPDEEINKELYKAYQNTASKIRMDCWAHKCRRCAFVAHQLILKGICPKDYLNILGTKRKVFWIFKINQKL